MITSAISSNYIGMEKPVDNAEHGRVLIVEDSPTQSLELESILESCGFFVRSARNGREALEGLSEWKPDLILSDIVMPEMGGYEFCRAVKELPDFKHIPVILLTSLSDPIDVIRGLECGADNFVVKPVDKDYLISQVSFILLNRKLSPAGSSRMGVEIVFGGQTFFITSDRLQILNLLLSTYETAVRQNRQLTETRGELEQVNERLEEKVLERTSALEAEIKERRRAEAQVRTLNRELEQRVRQRTAELEAANRELEAFSYSISHDLRAPLRTITSFAGAITKDFEPSGDLKHYVDRILAKSLKMRSMIDSLLMLSKYTSKPLHRGRIDVDHLVKEIVQELETGEEDRRLEWDIHPLLPCEGDPDLIRHVFSNLLSNAYKYTAGRETGRISVTCSVKGEEVVYSIADNGVGFDPSAASRIFEVFRRVHSEEEFEGNGIGLSIVKRIVDRHAGRVWAESEAGSGATFYVSLPNA